MIKIKNHVRNKTTIALLEGKLQNTTECIFNMEIKMTWHTWSPGFKRCRH